MGMKEYYKESVRVFKVTRKPTMSEFQKVLLITLVGMFIVGLIGFIIFMAYQSIF